MRKRKAASVLLPALLVVLLATAVSASPAAASPEWHFNGTLLSYGTQETVTAEATEASLTIPGLTTTCKPFVFKLTVENLIGGPGVGTVTGVPLPSCHTNSEACTVETATASGLPWPMHLTTIGSEHYFVIEGIKISFLYGGEECVLGGVIVVVKGAAGGLVDDSNHTVTFDSTTMQTVGAQLKALSQLIDLNGTFSWFPTGSKAGATLTVL
jgi:hypothetical protein